MDPPSQPPSDRSEAADVRLERTLDVTALTRRMIKGDEMAYREFYDAYFGRLSRYLLVVTHGNEDTAREALQRTFLRVVRHIKGFSNEAAFWSWLTVLARSSISDESRKRRRYFAFLDRFARHATIIEHSVSRRPHGEDRLRELLEENVSRLPPDERELLERKYGERRSVREIASQLQATEKAVESRLMRIRHKLKQAVLADLKNE